MKYADTVDALLQEFKNGNFLYGPGCLDRVGETASVYGNRFLVVSDRFPGAEDHLQTIQASVEGSGGNVVEMLQGMVRPNAPVEDMLLVKEAIGSLRPDAAISFGGGSTIDAVKAAIVLDVLGGDIEDYFGVGKVTEALEKSGKSMFPHIAIQSAASSAAHLTKYSNITNLETNQKKLIVDESIVPHSPVFDYSVTYNAPPGLTLDGALDGMSHCMEVFFGAVGKPYYEKAKSIASTAIGLIVEHLPRVVSDPSDKEARDALCAATDLGGYAIMVGGTSGPHLTSFSLVDVTTHGRACAVMNPYFAVFFAPAIGEPLRVLGEIYRKAGYTSADFASLQGRELGLAFAETMLDFAMGIGFPTRLSDFDNFREEHITRALEAAKNHQLRSKLENMPVPMTPEQVEPYMGSILRSAATGDLSLIRSMN